MRRIVTLTLVLCLSVAALPGSLLAAQALAAQDTGEIRGSAQDSAGEKLANHTIQLRSVDTAQLVASTTTDAEGEFIFTGVAPGTYVVEVVSPSASIVGTSSALSLSAGGTVTVGIATTTVVVPPAAVAAASGGSSTTLITLTTLAALGGVAGVVVSQSRTEASPSR